MTYDISMEEGFENREVALLFAALENSTREWREDELGEVPDAALLWKPIPSGYSIGGILLHMAWVEGYYFHDVLLGEARSPEELERLMSEQTDVDKGVWPSPPAQPLAWFYAQQDAVRERTRAALRAFHGDDVKQSRYGNTLTVRWLLAHVIQHDSYHGGQVVMLHEMYKNRSRLAQWGAVE